MLNVFITLLAQTTTVAYYLLNIRPVTELAQNKNLSFGALLRVLKDLKTKGLLVRAPGKKTHKLIWYVDMDVLERVYRQPISEFVKRLEDLEERVKHLEES